MTKESALVGQHLSSRCTKHPEVWQRHFERLLATWLREGGWVPRLSVTQQCQQKSAHKAPSPETPHCSFQREADERAGVRESLHVDDNSAI